MKILLIFSLVVALALGTEDCGEEAAQACVDNLLSSILVETSEEEICSELRTSVKCLRNAADECFGDEKTDEVEEGLAELSRALTESCGDADNNEVDDEMQKCFEENEDYIFECVFEGTTQTLSLVTAETSLENVGEKHLECLIYLTIADCFVDRVREKCGSEAAKLTEEVLNNDVPVEIVEACGETIMNNAFQLLEDRKK